MLLKTVEDKIKNEFPSLKFTTNKEDHVISIQEAHPEVGSIDIQDDIDELIIFVGNFTHWHIECYDESLNKEEKEQSMASEITEFLHDLFNNKIIMWGSQEKGGGFYTIEGNINEQDSPLEPEGIIKYVWTGRINS